MRRLFAIGDEWRFNEITLVPTVGDAWIYVVVFASPIPPSAAMAPARPVKPGEIMSVAGSQASTLMTLAVLMDGRAVEPIVTPVKPGER